MKVETFLKQNIGSLNKVRTPFNERLGFALVEMFKKVWGIKDYLFKNIKGFRKKPMDALGGICGFLILISVGLSVLPRSIQRLEVPESFSWLYKISLLILAYFASLGVLVVLFMLLIIILVFTEDPTRKRLIKKYRREGHGEITFSDATYKKAAEVLKKFRTSELRQARENYSKEIVDLLIMANGILIEPQKNFFRTKKILKRMVSIKSIQEDREAGPEDDDN